MEVRETHESELTRLVNECWKPFATEMDAVDRSNALAENAAEKQLAYCESRLTNESSNIYVAAENGNLVGYIALDWRDAAPIFERDGSMYITELYVKEDYRSQGIGSELIERGEQWAIKQGIDRVSLTVNQSNGSAQDLYRTSGYNVRQYTMDKVM